MSRNRVGVQWYQGNRPGSLIKTQFSQALWENPVGAKTVEGHSIPRIGKVDDIAGVTLASSSSSFITAHILTIDGGRYY
jgi:NAD(P)-dependent dehydrogenase (short-subunit alcohol dehydrogenase family)